MPALPLALHFLGEVDGFLAAAALVSSSERHPVSMQGDSLLCTFVIHCVLRRSSGARTSFAQTDRHHWQHLRLDATIPIKGEVPVCSDALLFLSLSLFQRIGMNGHLKDPSFLIVKCKVPAGGAQIMPNRLVQMK